MRKFIVFLLFIIISTSQIVKCQSQDSLKYGQLQKRWNTILTGNKWFNIDPNPFLAEIIANEKPGKALDIAMGEGRNSVYLALMGWDVTGYDIADQALDSAQASAKSNNVIIETVHASKDDFDHGIDKWDLVALIYADIAFGGSISNGGFIDTLAACVKKNGLVIYEFMHLDYFGEEAKAKGWGNTTENIVALFEDNGFKIEKLIDKTQKSDWSNKPERTISIAARKK